MVKGTNANLAIQRDQHETTYRAAKQEFNMDAAYSIIDRTISQAHIETLVDFVLESEMPLRIVSPHPAFDDDDTTFAQVERDTKPANAIPFALANFLSKTLDCPIDEEIVQAARVGRTKLNTWLRFLCQPSFKGEVRATHPYLIVDDVVTTGGTIAALRGFIVRSGGTVPITTALAHMTGHDQQLAIGQQSVDVLLSAYSRGLEKYWLEAIGHDIQCLTEAEGRLLLDWANQQLGNGVSPGVGLLHRLRDRVNQAAGKGG